MLNAKSARERASAYLQKAKLRYELGELQDLAALLLQIQEETFCEANYMTRGKIEKAADTTHAQMVAVLKGGPR